MSCIIAPYHKQGRRSVFRMGGGGQKFKRSKFSARFARTFPIYIFPIFPISAQSEPQNRLIFCLLFCVCDLQCFSTYSCITYYEFFKWGGGGGGKTIRYFCWYIWGSCPPNTKKLATLVLLRFIS